MVDRIRKMLGFQAESGMLPIHHATLSGDGSIQKVARIELDSRLSGPNLHLTTGGEIQNSSRQLQFSHLLAQHVIVVVPPGSPFISAMREPMVAGVVKSRGVPFTGWISPVGISVASTGV